ncbi:DUF1272 domain-containing protein [Leptospira gomenensis]|uniref:DUF1272 domain-containing protein n=1 Tax=Leptospira gomenensis TaxID=2484974 RepID=A0A5F1Y9P6_9LEPT|nr:DUF1272 domain-containing protein [Leptospira gomenensis]TGK31531.1 DUF1272 domain-containing protein [Leptospira gomenensis]TGK44181.1 DUF1272 domain-containing protein [Leptospira gomenensis]TGK46236.1 DUF1272 domain-containing protein [Leptospira gomenensis]TGK54761.1 DUF1272 domain-containing protein [Leptospira gomenensis]
MLELRPVCENCGKDLPPETKDVVICSFECTFCAECNERHLHGICPNCGGNFVPRPIRPKTNWKGDNYLGKYPAGTFKKIRPINEEEHERFAKKLSAIPPEER